MDGVVQFSGDSMPPPEAGARECLTLLARFLSVQSVSFKQHLHW